MTQTCIAHQRLPAAPGDIKAKITSLFRDFRDFSSRRVCVERNSKNTSVLAECEVNWNLDHKNMKVANLI